MASIISNKKARRLLISSNAWYFGEGLLGPFFAVFAQKVGGDILEISWSWAVYLIVFGVLTVFFGSISDKFSKEKIMIAGYGLNALMTFCYILVNDATGLFLVQAGLGVAAAMATPTWDALYDKYSGDKKVGASWGLADGTPKIITGVAVLVGGLIVSNSNFTMLFILMGTVQVIATLLQINLSSGFNDKK